jgi:SAM-dependent methyltransferase
MVQIADIATNLELQDDGIWYCRTKTPVSYPDQGSAVCFVLEDQSFWFRHRNDCIVEVVRQFPPAGPVLDIGGGNGFVSLGLVRAGLEAILVEPGPDGARNARSRGLATVICSSLEGAGFKTASIAGAGMFDVLEHIEADAQALQRIRGLLRPQGRLYLTVPAYNWLYSYEDEEAGHYRRYTAGTLAHLLQSAGFAVEYSTYIFAFLPAPIFLLRTLPTRLGYHGKITLAAARRDHAPPSGIAGRMLNALLGLEIRAIRKRMRIPFGGSCLVVARAR